MKILSIGNFSDFGSSNTCTLRTRALEQLGNNIYKIDTSGINMKYRILYRIGRHLYSRYLPDIPFANKKILREVETNSYDLVWIDKGITIYGETLNRIKCISPKTKIIGYSPDLMTVKNNQSKQFIESLPFYDLYVTTKSYAVEDMKIMGCKTVVYQGNAFMEDYHYPRQVTPDIFEKLGGDVGFIGAWEKERAESIIFLAKNNINVRVWGDKRWKYLQGKYPSLKIENKGLFSDEYCQALSAFKINLCFLRKINFDQQTTRSVEIPACKGFMLAERTKEHLELFREDEEAVYFSNNQELLEKCKLYLANSGHRNIIAIQGHNRCMSSGYSYKERIKEILSII